MTRRMTALVIGNAAYRNVDELRNPANDAEDIGRSREFCRRWPNQTEVSVKGIHYVQEDSPHEIGAALRAFLQRLQGR